MEKHVDETLRQKNVVLQRLDGDAKKEYYLAVFTSHLISSLKKTRKKLGINQDEIAKKTGLKQSYISKIENLEKNPTIETIAKYCYALNFSLEVVEVFEQDLTLEATNIPAFDFCRIEEFNQFNNSSLRMAI